MKKLSEIILEENERIDDLGDDFYIIQNTNKFLFGMDAVLLADFSSNYIKRKYNILEIGTGNGIIPILISKRTQFNSYIGVEIQEDMAWLAQRNIELNELDKNIKIVDKDIRNIDIKPNSLDIIITNPPYFPLLHSEKSKRDVITKNSSKLIARNEVTLFLKDIFKVAKRGLKQGGKLLMIHKPTRLSEIFSIAQKYQLEPKKLRFIYSRINSEAVLVLIEFIRDGKPFLKVEPPLIIYNDQGYTKEVLEIYENVKQ